MKFDPKRSHPRAFVVMAFGVGGEPDPRKMDVATIGIVVRFDETNIYVKRQAVRRETTAGVVSYKLRDTDTIRLFRSRDGYSVDSTSLTRVYCPTNHEVHEVMQSIIKKNWPDRPFVPEEFMCPECEGAGCPGCSGSGKIFG